MFYIRYFLRSLGLGGLVAFLLSLVYELLKSCNGNIDSKK